MGKINLKNSWDSVSEYYQKVHKISPNHIHYGPFLQTESELKLLGNVRGRKVLEIGRGGGQCSIAFAKKGAKVTGMDLSSKQIEFAKNLAKKEKVNVDFIVGNIENLKPIKSASIDIVFSAYAFEYVKNLKKCFSESYRVLKANGLFVFSLDHPFKEVFDFGTLKVTSSYYKKGVDYWKFETTDGKMRKFYNFRRTLESMVSDLVDQGFVIERILEPAPIGKDKAWDWSKEYPLEILKMIPYTIIFKCRKK